MAVEKFESLVAALEGLFEKPFDELPGELRARVQPGRWGREDAAARRKTADYWDYNNDPATEEERRGHAAFIDKLHDVRADVEEDERLALKKVETWADKDGVLKARERLARAIPIRDELEKVLQVKRGDFPEAEVSDCTQTQVKETAQQSSGTAAKPWLVKDPNDPEPPQPWYTSARYFARQLVAENPTLLVKRPNLAVKVAQALKNVGILKRGGKRPLGEATVRKAFSNIKLG